MSNPTTSGTTTSVVRGCCSPREPSSRGSLGFVGAILLARTLGTIGSGADAFALANQIPNNVYALVAGGILTAILVPHIVRAGTDDDGGAGYINKIVTLGFVIFLGIAALATLLAPVLVGSTPSRPLRGPADLARQTWRLRPVWPTGRCPKCSLRALQHARRGT